MLCSFTYRLVRLILLRRLRRRSENDYGPIDSCPEVQETSYSYRWKIRQ